jgi:hypothetical protein
MPFSHTQSRNFSSGSSTLTDSKTYSGTAELNISETLPIGTNTALTAPVDISTLVSLYMKCDTDCTIKVNSTGSPTKTIALVAGEPYVWPCGGLTAPLGASDTTVFYVTNAAECNLDIRILQDSTP